MRRFAPQVTTPTVVLEEQKEGQKQNHTQKGARGRGRSHSLVQVDRGQPVRLLHLVHHQVELRPQARCAVAAGRSVEEAVAALRNAAQVGLQLLQILLHALREEGEKVKGAPEQAEKSRC